jgi:hypothetical protein
MDSSAKDAALVKAFLERYATRDDSLLRAFIEVNDIAYKEAERGWSITQALIAAAPDDSALGYIAAGPLDEVLEVHGRQIIDRVEDPARRDPKFLKGPFPRGLL